LSASARRELAAAGDPAAQLQMFEAQMRAGGADALLTLVFQLKTIIDQVTQMQAALPEAAACAAFPQDAYTELRRIFDIQSPGVPQADLQIAIIVLADHEPLAELHALVSACCDQAHQRWCLIAIGADPDRRAIMERAAAHDERIVWRGAVSDRSAASAELETALSLETDWVLLLAPGAKPHRQALAWIAGTAIATGCKAMVFDEEAAESGETSTADATGQ